MNQAINLLDTEETKSKVMFLQRVIPVYMKVQTQLGQTGLIPVFYL
jgi:hypothetical protein